MNDFDEKLLAHEMGHAFSHAVHVYTLMGPGELMIPYVIYWQDNSPSPVPYPASNQDEAVQASITARNERSPYVSGWAAGREGLLRQADGRTLDVLVIEGWVKNLNLPVEMFVLVKKDPFHLMKGFIWKTHSEARKNAPSFMADFKLGILSHSFGAQCLDYLDRAQTP